MFQLEIITRGVLDIENKYLLDVKSRKTDYLKFYCNHANIMANQKDYTLNDFSYMFMLGTMEKEDFLCVNTEKHDLAT